MPGKSCPTRSLRCHKEEIMRYFDVHIVVEDDCKPGYSIFVQASSEEEALEIIKREKLYEDIEDLDNIDYVGEITEEQYKASL